MQTIREHPQRVLYELLLMYVEQPEQLFDMLGRGQSGQFLRLLWGLVAEILTVQQRLAFDDVDVWYQPPHTEDHEVLVVQLPTPQRVHEVRWFGLYRVADRVGCFVAVCCATEPQLSYRCDQVTSTGRYQTEVLSKRHMTAFVAAMQQVMQQSQPVYQAFLPSRLDPKQSLLALQRHRLIEQQRASQSYDERTGLLDLDSLAYGRQVVCVGLASFVPLMLAQAWWPRVSVALAFVAAMLSLWGSVWCAMSLRYPFLLYIFWILMSFIYPLNLLMLCWFYAHSTWVLRRYGYQLTWWGGWSNQAKHPQA